MCTGEKADQAAGFSTASVIMSGHRQPFARCPQRFRPRTFGALMNPR